MNADTFDLLVFDWDGTIFDSIGTIVACTLATLEDLDLPGEVPEERIRHTIGLGLRETLEILLPGAGEEMHQRLREVYFRHWPRFCDRPVLFPGTEAALRNLEKDGYLLAVATGKSRRGLNRDLERTGTSDLFAATRTVDEAPSKPNPKMLLDILEELGVHPERALMVGDTTYDLEMARAAGVAAVGVTSGSHQVQLLESFQPLTCLPSVAELGGWLESCYATPA